MRWLGPAALVLFVPALGAQESIVPVVLKLHPAATPSPAMKHYLLPQARELQPGNAAVFYQRAHSPEWFRSLDRIPLFSKMHEWVGAVPIGQLPEKDVRQLLQLTGVFKELDVAARCESCDWQMHIRLKDEGVGLVLPDMHGFRQMSQMLAIKARMELQDGQSEPALRTLQTGFAFGRHVGDCPIVINALVGMAMSQTMLGVVEDFVQRPGAPNLYWALRDLPEPFIDLRRPLQGDRLAVDAWWPDIRKALGEPKFKPLPLHTLRTSLDKAVAFTRYEQRVSAATMVALIHPRAMSHFRALGHSQEELDGLPVTQVVLMYSLSQWDHWYDAVYRWHNVPYWQARAGLKKAAQEREEMLRHHRDNSFLLEHLLPASEPIFFQKARLQRRIAGLQCVEAIRAYAAANQGTLPATLADIRGVPVPHDPVTGKSFEYTVESATARLRGPAPPGEVHSERSVLLYELSIAKRD